MNATATTPLPTWAADTLAAIPKRGNGLNRALMSAAIALRRCGRDEIDIRSALDVATAGEPVEDGEIDRAVKRSINYMTASGQTRKTTFAKWPAVDAQARQKIIDAADFNAADLWESSPVRYPDETPHTADIIEAMFPAQCLLCVGETFTKAITDHCEKLGDLSRFQFLVPSPMHSETGNTQDGRKSARCLENVGPRRYLVVEQDGGSDDEQAAIIAHLAGFAPLVLALRSGSKSLHAWFSCEGATQETVRKFFALAVRIGADPATWTPCQFVRMPDGLRRWPDGRTARQSVLYFAADAIGGGE